MGLGPVSQLHVELEVADADQGELARHTSRLRRDLLELDVERVEVPSSGPAPAGARALDLETIGALIITVQEGRTVLMAVVDRLRDWVARDEDRSVKLTINGDSIELTRVSSEDQSRLIEVWLDRRTPKDEYDRQAQRAPHRNE